MADEESSTEASSNLKISNEACVGNCKWKGMKGSLTPNFFV